MCDYSLHAVASRPAKVGEKLVSTKFRGSITVGFADEHHSNVAVCLLPGTEVAFEKPVRRRGFFAHLFSRKIRHRVARFTQVNLENQTTHHDALEFPDELGPVQILLDDLEPGQRVSILQLPPMSSEKRRTYFAREPHTA